MHLLPITVFQVVVLAPVNGVGARLWISAALIRITGLQWGSVARGICGRCPAVELTTRPPIVNGEAVALWTL